MSPRSASPVVATARRGGRFRVPLAGWVALGVVAFHIVFFWIVADKHFLPKTRHLPPPPRVNFGSTRTVTVDPQTGEVTTETLYVVSTKLASPSPAPSASP